MCEKRDRGYWTRKKWFEMSVSGEGKFPLLTSRSVHFPCWVNWVNNDLCIAAICAHLFHVISLNIDTHDNSHYTIALCNTTLSDYGNLPMRDSCIR